MAAEALVVDFVRFLAREKGHHAFQTFRVHQGRGEKWRGKKRT
jgi:hypothetical protein